MNILDDPADGHFVEQPFRGLAAAIIGQARRDYFNGKSFAKQVDAALWLRSRAAQFYFQALDLFDFDAMKLLTGPKPAKLTQRKGGRHARPARNS